MSRLRILLIVANLAAVGTLLAVPLGRLLGWIEAALEAAAVIGWLMYFVPALASALALFSIQRAHTPRSGRAILVAMPGSFLLACLSLYAALRGPSAWIGAGATILFALNVWALWVPFLERLQPPASK